MEQQHSARTNEQGPGQGRGGGHERGRGSRGEGGKGSRNGNGNGIGSGDRVRGGGRGAEVPRRPGTKPSTPGAGPPPGGRSGGRAAATEGEETATVYRVRSRGPRVPLPLGRLPRPRLTALGSGVFAVLLTMVAAAVARWLLDGSTTAYGVGFALVGVVCVGWARPADLFAAPLAVPLAFVAGLAVLTGGETAGSGGISGRAMALFTALALNAVWLYSGTGAAVLVVVLRKLVQIGQRSRPGAGTAAGDDDETAERPGPRAGVEQTGGA